MMVFDLDDLAGHHLVRAIDDHRRWCRANGTQLPAGLEALAVHLAARAGQGRPSVAPDAGWDDCEPVVTMSPIVVTMAEAAARLRVSERSVRRLVSSGELPAVTVAGCRRIHTSDLIDFADALRRSQEAGSAPFR